LNEKAGILNGHLFRNHCWREVAIGMIANDPTVSMAERMAFSRHSNPGSHIAYIRAGHNSDFAFQRAVSGAPMPKKKEIMKQKTTVKREQPKKPRKSRAGLKPPPAEAKKGVLKAAPLDTKPPAKAKGVLKAAPAKALQAMKKPPAKAKGVLKAAPTKALQAMKKPPAKAKGVLKAAPTEALQEMKKPPAKAKGALKAVAGIKKAPIRAITRSSSVRRSSRAPKPKKYE
jgi:hypothetical protein